MKKYGKYYILIGIIALALGITVGFLVKNLVTEPAAEIVSEEIQDNDNQPF